jgi:lipoate-protein ligase A
MRQLPRFPGHSRKNDALFMYGAVQPKPFVFVYEQHSVEVVYGPSCRCDNEIRLDRCEADGVPVMERRNGGGTVVLGPGMVITLIVGERNRQASATDYFSAIHDAMIALLSEAGIKGVVRNGISDCALNNRKILGSSLYIGTRPPLYYYQSSLLVAPDLSLFERYLHHPPREPAYRQHRSHRDFCTSLEAEGYSPSPDAVRKLFAARLAKLLVGAKTEG